MTRSSSEDGWCVLLVDDDEDDYVLTSLMLSEAKGRKVQLDWAATYTEAKSLLSTHTYDAVLIDYDLGNTTGPALIREMADAGYPAPLILYTGRGSYAVDLEAMEAGATLYLTKAEATPLLLERFIRYAIERKHAEESLRRHSQELEAAREEAEAEKRRLEAIFNALPVGAALVDTAGGLLHFNTAYHGVWKAPIPETRSVKDYAAFQAWWADTGEPVKPEEWASALAVTRGETVTGQILEIRRFDGTQAFVINSAAPVLNSKGKIIGSAVTIQDITDLRRAELALKRSEDKYRDLFASLSVQRQRDHELQQRLKTAPAILAYIDAEFRFGWVNAGFEQQYRTSLEAVRGQPAPVVVGKAAWKVLRPWLQRALSGEPVVYELALPSDHGPSRRVYGMCIPDRDLNGGIQGMIIHEVNLVSPGDGD